MYRDSVRLLSGKIMGLSVGIALALCTSAFAVCEDNDGDGWGTGADCLGPDCDDNDPDVHPGATEICNGKDDNCNGQIDEGFMLQPDSLIPVYGFESLGVCDGTATPCDLRFPLPPDCSCVPTTHNFSQVIQACVDGGSQTGEPCDNGDPDAPGSLGYGNECAGGGDCVPIPVGLGQACLIGNGVCRRIGTVVCSADGLSAVCDAVPGDPEVADEGAGPDPAHDPLCFDQLDNDCDAQVDHEDGSCQTAELCDGFDNDGNGLIDDGIPNLGQPCTVGLVGSPCENTGVYICDETGGVKCSVTPNPKLESTEQSCGDGIDNDCDGTVDCADTDCTSPTELCDGVDNNCNGQVDEGFAGLGDPCTLGVGACQASGHIVCTQDRHGTMCDATPLPSSLEKKTAGNSCTDGIDNDCDGKTDAEEAECVAGGLTVACSLVYDDPPKPRGRGEHGSDCEGWHVLDWMTTGATGDVECKAVLKGLEPNGNVVGTLGPVAKGQQAHLVSRLDPEDWKFYTRDRITREGEIVWHEVYAPIPLLEVTCRDDATTASAYCSNVPYLEVIEPDGSVVNGATGDEVDVKVAIPRIDPASLHVLIDCVDIIPQLVADPATQLPGGPFSGLVDINGTNMQIIDLFVRTPDVPPESSIEDKAANIVTMTIVGAGCGGHALSVQGEPATDFMPDPNSKITPNCHQEGGDDLGQWSVFSLDVTSPMTGQIIDNGGLRPTSIQVTGEVCHGLDIAQVLIQGHEATLPAATVEPLGGGDCAGDAQKVTVSFDENLPITDMAAVFAGTNSTRGSFDPGPNKLVAQATDVQGNTTHDLVPFVVGPALATPVQVNQALQMTIANSDPTTIHKAFTLVLNNSVTLDNGNSALREFFDQFVYEFSLNLANCMLQPREYCCEKELEMPWWTCNPDVTFCTIPDLQHTPEEFASTFQITITPQDGFLTIRVEVPNFRINVDADGECCTGGCGFFCIARTNVDFHGSIDIPALAVEIDITEANILQQDGLFTLRFFPGDDDNINVNGDIGDAITTGCSLLSVGTIFDVLTGGIIALHRLAFDGITDLLGFIVAEKGVDLCPFVRQVGGKDGMKDKSHDVEMCRQDLGPSFDLGLSHEIEAVDITTDGIAISVAATVEPTQVDPNGDVLTATLLTDAPLVAPNYPGLRSISMAISDDFWNQLIAGMTQSGKFRAQFTKVLDLGSYLPTNCEDILTGGGLLAERRYARCVGMTECTDPSDFDNLDRCQACLDQFPFGRCGGDGDACMLDNDCPGTCDGVCSGGPHDGESCIADIGCGLGGTCVKTCTDGPTPGATCTLDIQCRDDCITCLADDDANCTRGACIRAARKSRDKKIDANTDIVLHARLESPPALYLDDDLTTTDFVEMIFRSGEMRAALIANRDGNNDVQGYDLGDGSCDPNTLCDPEHKCDQGDLDKLDLTTLPDCFDDSTPNNVDCLLWSTCLDLNVKFQLGVHNELVDGVERPQIDFHLVGIVDPPPDAVVPDQGEQCSGSFEIPDLDFLNTEALRNDSRKGLERSFCENTPPFQGCALDFNGSVEFLNPRLFTVSTCADNAVCDTNFDDYLVITGDLKAIGLGLIAADNVCKNIEAKTSEPTGTCKDNGGDEEREKLCD